MIGVDRPRMKLFEVEASAQAGLDDSGKDDAPVFDKTAFGKRMKNAGESNNFNF
jgi:hypothetical protein